jgi:hypothetical protein
MSPLITTLIAIALTAVLAIASLFYGGDRLLSSRDDASAAQIINGASQITAAIDLYRTRNAGKLPVDVKELVNGGYLAGLPDGDWTFVDGGVERSDLTDTQCAAVNKRVTSDPAIPSCGAVPAGFSGCCTN